MTATFNTASGVLFNRSIDRGSSADQVDSTQRRGVRSSLTKLNCIGKMNPFPRSSTNQSMRTVSGAKTLLGLGKSSNQAGHEVDQSGEKPRDRIRNLSSAADDIIKSLRIEENDGDKISKGEFVKKYSKVGSFEHERGGRSSVHLFNSATGSERSSPYDKVLSAFDGYLEELETAETSASKSDDVRSSIVGAAAILKDFAGVSTKRISDSECKKLAGKLEPIAARLNDAAQAFRSPRMSGPLSFLCCGGK